MSSVTSFNTTTTQTRQLHFVLFPYMAQGHMIPMMGIANLLATRGVKVTVVTTPLNAARLESPAISKLGLQIDVVKLRFPCVEAGLPEGCENVDMLPSFSYVPLLLMAASMMEPQVESLLETMTIRPSCIISDLCLAYTYEVAKKFNVPRISFNGTSCFTLACTHFVRLHEDEIHREVSSDHEYFVIPGLPRGIKFTKAQLSLPPPRKLGDADSWLDKFNQVESETYGMIVNSFEELEPEYFSEFKTSKRGRVWCLGPVSLTNTQELGKVQRGTIDISTSNCSHDWLNTKEPESVIYVCFGSVCNLSSPQMIELALGLEASQKPFIWVIREPEKTEEFHRWIVDYGFEGKVAGRGMVIRGWAPQVMILSHNSVGGFLTHCGWNSTLEGISSGTPLVTWPLNFDQFCNEKLIVEVLRIGVSVGAERPLPLFEEGDGSHEIVERRDVQRVVRLVLDGGEEGDERKKRAKELAKMARRAFESGGSSSRHVDMLINDIVEQQEREKNGTNGPVEKLEG